MAACASRVLLRTADYVVVDKPPDVRMDGVNHDVTMQTLAEAWLGAVPRFCHRLDYGTSGLLLGAFSKRAAAVAGAAFERKTARKEYVSVVRGVVEADDFVVDAPLGPFGDGDFRVRVGGPKAKPATTRCRVLQRCAYLGQPCTKVALTPVTGRRHQLRVHMRHVGHPLVGDATYDDSPTAAAPRMMLHARSLVVPLGDAERLVAETPDPFVVDDAGALRPRIDDLPLDPPRTRIVPIS